MYKPYPKYKDSGVEWLGDVPEHWESYRIDWFSTIIRGNTGFKKDELLKNGEYVALQYGKTYKVDEVNDAFKFYVNSEFYKDSQVVHHGDTILISTSETVADLGHSCFYNRIDLGLIGGEQILLKPNRELVDEKYLYYSAKVFCKTLRKYATGLKVFRFNTDDLKSIFAQRPPLQEQKTIANYLDSATAKIDALIEKQTKLIALLKEKRQAVISTAVTRGLDSTVAMKESGVEWLGEIPEGWRAVSLKYISRITLGKMLTSSDKGNMNFKPYLKAKNLKWMKVDISDVDNMWFTDNEIRSLRLKKDDLLVSEGGEVGRTCIWNDELEECYIQNSVNRVQFMNYLPRFFLYQFFSAGHYGYFDSIVNKISIAHLTKEKLGDAKFVVAPVIDQQKIVSYLDDKTTKIDTLITKATKAIDLLKEKRTALISSAVTGKIDVREIA